MTDIDRINTPLKWLRYVHSLHLDEYGEKLDRATRKACDGQAHVASMCILGLAAFTEPVTLVEVRKVVLYPITPASVDRIVRNGLADLIPGSYRTWKLNKKGLEVAKAIEAGLEKLIAKVTKPVAAK